MSNIKVLLDMDVCLVDGEISLYHGDAQEPLVSIDLLDAVKGEVGYYVVPAACKNPEEGVILDHGGIKHLRNKLQECVDYIDSWGTEEEDILHHTPPVDWGELEDTTTLQLMSVVRFAKAGGWEFNGRSFIKTERGVSDFYGFDDMQRLHNNLEDVNPSHKANALKIIKRAKLQYHKKLKKFVPQNMKVAYCE